MSLQFLHGIETVEISDGIRPIQTVKSSVIGIIGTAPDADVDKFPLNTPVLVMHPRHAADLGEAGELPDALDAIFSKIWAWCVVVRVEEGATAAETMSNVIGDPTQLTGVYSFLKPTTQLSAEYGTIGVKPRILIAPGFTSLRPTSALSWITLTNAGSGYTAAPKVNISGTGTGARARALLTGTAVSSILVESGGIGYTSGSLPTVAASGGGSGFAGTVQVKHGKITGVTITNGGTGYNTPTISFSGGGGSGATATATVVGGVITGITITNGGSGYVGPTTVSLSSGSGAAATAVVENGRVAQINVTAGGQDYVTAPTVSFSGGGGTGAVATAQVLNGAVVGFTITNGGSGYTTAPTVGLTAVGSGATATAQLGNYANPVVAALLTIAPRLRAVVFADGPATTDAAVLQYRSDWGSDRLFIIDPMAVVWDVDQSAPASVPASAHAAGLQAWVDNNQGFWWSPSNHEIAGIIGASRPIDFRPNDANSQANYLNENGIATIVHHQGYRLWGNRTTATDPLWAFLPVRRTADMVYESIEQSMLWALDRPISKNSLLEIQESVREYLRHLVVQGALVGGNAWVDPTINTPAELAAGHVYIDFDIEPPAPIERLTFRAHRNIDYYEELINQVIRATR